jgi:uncharacterized protein (TIGR02594 family)
MSSRAAAFAALLLAVATPALGAGRYVSIPSPTTAPSLGAGATGMAWLSGSRSAQVAWRSGAALVAEAMRFDGAGKFTRLPGPWCADAVSFWLRAIGKRPLPSRMAASALAYGPRVVDPQPGDLVVLRGERGWAGHVAVVVAARGEAIEIISGNWSHRVARSVVARRRVVAFVMT